MLTLDRQLQTGAELVERMWARREIENYLCQRDVLLAWVSGEANRQAPGPRFATSLTDEWTQAMEEAIAEVEKAMETLGKGSPWSPDTKVSDDFLDPLFSAFFRKLGWPNLMNKSDYHRLARYLKAEQIDPEVREVLDDIVEVKQRARPLGEEPL